MNISTLRNLRRYEGEAGGTSQADTSKSQADTSETTQKPDDAQDAATELDDATTAKIAKANKEAASYRTQLREAQEQLKALQAQVEEATTASMSESERLKATNAKLLEQVKAAQAQAKEAERLRMAQSAIIRFELEEEFLPALSGETQDEIDEAAERLKKVVLARAKKLAQVQPPNPEGGPKPPVTNGHLTAEQSRKHEMELARVF